MLIINQVKNWLFVREGLEGCPANSSEINADRRRGAKRREIDSTIKDLKAEINGLRILVQVTNPNIINNTKRLEKISEAAVKKAEKNKEKMDKLK